jgi:hypothetical protein
MFSVPDPSLVMIGTRHIETERAMAEHCFIKKGSHPPTCGVHNVPLEHKQLPEEMVASGYKAFTYLACPVSGEVLNDEAKN